MTIIQKSALIKFSAQTMFELVDDIESYPEFLPWCAGSKIIRREKDIVEAELKISRGGFTKTFSTRNVSDAGGRIRLSLINGPYHRRFLDGFYPYHVSLNIHYPYSLLLFQDSTPEQQNGFSVIQETNKIIIDTYFEGILNTEIRFKLKE